VYSSHMMAVYTGFAIVLTTLIWVYLSWLILLIGAELAFYVQFPQYLRYGQEPVELSSRGREQAALSVMYLIGRDYVSDEPKYWSSDRLATELEVPGAALAPVLSSLEGAGLIVATEKEQFLPGREPEHIGLSDVIKAVSTQHKGRFTPGSRAIAPVATVMAEVEAGMRQKLSARTLKDLIAVP